MLQTDMNRVTVLDYGGQYAHLIARRVRTLGIYSEIVSPSAFDPAYHRGCVGVILSGGPQSVSQNDAHSLSWIDLYHHLPVLGLCYGHQLLARYFGGTVRAGTSREYGKTQVRVDIGSSLFHSLNPEQSVWMSHHDMVASVPPAFRVTATSDCLPIAGFEAPDRHLFGLQFHPEVSHTPNGMTMLDNFLTLCDAARTWRASDRIEALISGIRDQAKQRNIFLLLSGGVDSLVCLVLCVRAVGAERVFPLHIDTGFMRLGESAQIAEHMSQLGVANLRVIDAADRFIPALHGVFDPERKRERIGRLFVELMTEGMQSNPVGGDALLVQGTIYPDTIESGDTYNAALIKTHHNRVPEIRSMIEQGCVIEPIADFYKDEVRSIGRALGIPERLVERHPFPGPGLAVRMLASEDDLPKPGYDRHADIAAGLAAEYDLRAVILPVRSVGVQGDLRTYRAPAAVFAPGGGVPDWERLMRCSAAITNGIASINRVVLSIREIDRHDLRLRRSFLTQRAITELQLVDDLVHAFSREFIDIWQMPVVSLPLFNRSLERWFVMRPVCSVDAMTAEAFQMPASRILELAQRVSEIPGVAGILYDLTSKPPATIEWE